MYADVKPKCNNKTCNFFVFFLERNSMSYDDDDDSLHLHPGSITQSISFNGNP